MENSSLSNINGVEEHANELKYKGVRKRKWGKYVSEIRLPNSRERIWLGSYDTAEKAARAFDAAQFCLRGHNANFNFPDDPPNIVDGQSLTPSEIQAVAQQYAITCAPPPSSNSNSIDWSFLDMLGSNGTGDNAGNITDFGLFQEPGDMYMPLHFAANQGEEYNYDDDYHGNNVGNAPSFLWNF